MALIAETSSGFVEAFFFLPVCRLSRRPVGDSNGRRSAGFPSAKLQGLLASCQPAAIITGDEWLPLVNAATHNNPELHVLSHARYKALPEADVALQRPVRTISPTSSTPPAAPVFPVASLSPIAK